MRFLHNIGRSLAGSTTCRSPATNGRSRAGAGRAGARRSRGHRVQLRPGISGRSTRPLGACACGDVAMHRAGPAGAARFHRELHRQAAGRMPQRALVRQPGGCPADHCSISTGRNSVRPHCGLTGCPPVRLPTDTRRKWCDTTNPPTDRMVGSVFGGTSVSRHMTKGYDPPASHPFACCFGEFSR